jgi:YD repeat-containing protein
MKKTTIFFTASILLLCACKKELSPEAAVTSCKITEIVTTGSDGLSGTDPVTTTSTQKISYNMQNLLSGYSVQTQGIRKSTKTYTFSSSVNHQYNESGYLLKTITQNTGKDETGKQNSDSQEATFTYSSNRLVKKILTGSSIDGGKTTTSNAVYTYDYTVDGKLSKYSTAYTTSDGTNSNYFTIYEYSGGKLSNISYSDGRGGIISPLIEINSQGLITKFVNTTKEYRYVYNAAGNLTRTEEFNSGKVVNIRVTETDDKNNVLAMLNPVFKGHPNTNFYHGKDNAYLFTGNIIKDENFRIDAAGIQKSDGVVYKSYSYNGSNLPATVATVYKDYAGKTSSQLTTSYTYTGCR